MPLATDPWGLASPRGLKAQTAEFVEFEISANGGFILLCFCFVLQRLVKLCWAESQCCWKCSCWAASWSCPALFLTCLSPYVSWKSSHGLIQVFSSVTAKSVFKKNVPFQSKIGNLIWRMSLKGKPRRLGWHLETQHIWSQSWNESVRPNVAQHRMDTLCIKGTMYRPRIDSTVWMCWQTKCIMTYTRRSWRGDTWSEWTSGDIALSDWSLHHVLQAALIFPLNMLYCFTGQRWHRFFPKKKNEKLQGPRGARAQRGPRRWPRPSGAQLIVTQSLLAGLWFPSDFSNAVAKPKNAEVLKG